MLQYAILLINKKLLESFIIQLIKNLIIINSKFIILKYAINHGSYAMIGLVARLAVGLICPKFSIVYNTQLKYSKQFLQIIKKINTNNSISYIMTNNVKSIATCSYYITTLLLLIDHIIQKIDFLFFHSQHSYTNLNRAIYYL